MAGCSMITSLEALETLIETAVADAVCEVDRVTITAGRPNAPVGEDCTVIYIFTDDLTDDNQDDPNACQVKSRLTMGYEIHTCYPVTEEDETDEDHAVAAECLYELMGLVWCALVVVKDSGDPFGDCEFVELGPLEVQPREGGNVSALGSVTIPYECVSEVVD